VPMRPAVPDASLRMTEARAVPDFKKMHDDWTNKIQRSKQANRKNTTVTQEFQFATRRPKEQQQQSQQQLQQQQQVAVTAGVDTFLKTNRDFLTFLIWDCSHPEAPHPTSTSRAGYKAHSLSSWRQSGRAEEHFDDTACKNAAGFGHDASLRLLLQRHTWQGCE